MAAWEIFLQDGGVSESLEYVLRLQCRIYLVTTGRPWSGEHSIMLNVTWRRIDQTAKQLVVGHATMKYDNPRLKMSHSGCALVRHFQPRVHHISMTHSLPCITCIVSMYFIVGLCHVFHCDISGRFGPFINWIELNWLYSCGKVILVTSLTKRSSAIAEWPRDVSCQ